MSRLRISTTGYAPQPLTPIPLSSSSSNAPTPRAAPREQAFACNDDHQRSQVESDGDDDDEGEPMWATTPSSRRFPRMPDMKTAADNVLPVFSPTSQSPQDSEKPYLPGQVRSLEGIALQSFSLGIALALSAVAALAVLVLTSSPLWRVPFFLAAIAVFHFLEFWTTAKYNTRVVKANSFLLLSNWPAYQLALAAAAVECVLTQLLFPRRSWAPAYSGHILLLLGLILVAGGQVVRSAAMAQAGVSFNHTVQRQHKESHVLVMTGIYGTFRHPAYFGFFWWAIGTQLVLGNVVCTAAYAAMLWTFFSGRIREEEDHLVRFFGQDYIDYRKRVGTKMPFI